MSEEIKVVDISHWRLRGLDIPCSDCGRTYPLDEVCDEGPSCPFWDTCRDCPTCGGKKEE